MAARAAASGSISFGMVSIPVKYYIAASAEGISFRMITPNGNPIKQKYIDPEDGKELSQSDCQKGFEYEKNKYVIFSAEEIKALEANGPKGCTEIQQFVPIDSIDLVHVEKSYYIKPDKGGDKAFKLLSNVMEMKNKAAVGQWTNRGRDHLVIVRPYKGGLILHTLFYKNEVRDYDDNCAVLPISDAEMNMASQLIDQLSVNVFDPNQYHDGFTQRVMNAVEKKRIKSNQIINTINASKPVDINLFEALQASLKNPIDNKATKTQHNKKKKPFKSN